MAKDRQFRFDLAEEVADKYQGLLEPFCLRCEIAGSVRREEEWCGDIDIVLVRDESKSDEFTSLVDSWHRLKGNADGKWMCRIPRADGIMLDIVMCTEANFGWNMIARTGPTNLYLNMRHHLESMDETDRNFAEEKDAFAALGMTYLEPQERSQWKGDYFTDG